MIENIIWHLEEHYAVAGYGPTSPHPYVACFSSALNDLNQFRVYGSQSGSYAIGFELDNLEKWAREHHFQIRRCDYHSERLETFTLQATESTLEAYRMILNEMKDGSRPQYPHPEDMVLDRFMTEFEKVELETIKDPCYAPEDEYRMVYWPLSDKNPPCFREGTSTIIPYVELDLPQENGVLSVNEIIVGPTPNPELAVRAVQELLERQNIDPHIVRNSGIPYRNRGA